MTRIAVGGFLHETNTFAPTKATFADFQHGGGWPAMTEGADVLKVMRRINVGLAGFVDSAEANGWELIPTIACGASPMEMGPSAALRIDNVRVVVSSHKAQLADQAMYRYVGIEPTQEKILVNKSSVHFRADFEPIAEKLMICAAPGAMPADTGSLPWTRLHPGIRIKPNGPVFNPPSR
ncbi:MlrC C-terminal domain-containing protein [Bradyrhizobium sp. PMVTL-01]|uniref:MlrC C-terminal domain-containing protein n=1 Tax=unclassified Bradyrhizobium TaxID=2631580 RepID=UPI003F713A26